eukprot:m.323891 g.323891  ORF g.323891 m.323891 type:complete len:55 (-) comp20363_c0_seq6:1262-1426(-)
MPYFSIWNFIELVTTVMLALHVCTASSTPGVVSLDDWTFDKVGRTVQKVALVLD